MVEIRGFKHTHKRLHEEDATYVRRLMMFSCAWRDCYLQPAPVTWLTLPLTVHPDATEDPKETVIESLSPAMQTLGT